MIWRPSHRFDFMAGFELVGETKGGLLAWQMRPEKMPAARAVKAWAVAA